MKKIVIFGVGLIGGSIALALKKVDENMRIWGVDTIGVLDKAIKLRVIDEKNIRLSSTLEDADVIILATPVSKIPSILKEIKQYIEPYTIITDVGSTKLDVISAVNKILDEDQRDQFVPGHPIAGAEKSGVSAAKADMFINKAVVLTPIEFNKNVIAIESMWKSIGAIPSIMTAAVHDQIFASVSHLPHLLAFALVDELSNRHNADDLFAFAASGFRDFTRIAGSNPEMWRDISLANRNALITEISAYKNKLDEINKLLEQSDSKGLLKLFERASEARNDWGKNH